MNRKYEYAQKLRDPRWQKVRLEVMARDNWTCQVCGRDDLTLHVHHAAYVGDDPWETPTSLLFCICSECHEVEHQSHKDAISDLLGLLSKIGCVTSADIACLYVYAEHDAFDIADGRSSTELSSGEWAAAFSTAIEAFAKNGILARKQEWNHK